MNWKLGGSKRGVFFTLDSVFALLILMTLFSVFTLLSIETVSTENIHQQLRFQAEDAVVVLAKTKLWEVRYLPVVQEMEASGTLVQIDQDYSVMEVVGALWATNNTENMTYARKLMQQTLGPSMSPNVKWEATIDNETVYNTTKMSQARFMSTVSNRLVSGYMKGRPHVGYTARAFLSNIRGKSENAYLFFGGFWGQGEITGYIAGIPSDSNVTGFYIEARTESDFKLLVNGTDCKPGTLTIMNTTTGYLNYSLDECKKYINRNGSDTKIKFVFTDTNVSKQYLGGGYVRVTYQTDKMASLDTGKMRYYFPGIYGVINIFDSFFVPGKITSITGFVNSNVSTSYSTYILLGNATIYNQSGSGKFNATTLTSSGIAANLSTAGLTFNGISNTTIPLRFGTPEMAFLFGGRESDVVLVTDVSGSMAWCQDQTEACCSAEACETTPCSCGSSGESCGYESAFFKSGASTVCAQRSASSNCSASLSGYKKISSVKLAEKEFADILFAPGSGSRLGLVDYSSPANGTRLLPDISITDFNVTPSGVYLKTNQGHAYTIKVTNEGFAPVTNNFTVAIFFPGFAGNESPMSAINFSVDPSVTPLPPGGTVTLQKTVWQNFTSLGPYAIAYADCGGNFIHPLINATSTINSAYPNVCPPSVGAYGTVEEYLPSFDGIGSNNFKTANLQMGVDLTGAITSVISQPNYTYSYYNPWPTIRSIPIICASSSRLPYNQSLLINFNVTNTGVLNILLGQQFNVTLKRWNNKCSYWETVNMSAGFCRPDIGFGCSGGSPMLFVGWSNATMFAGQTVQGTFVWDVENYVPPTCPGPSFGCGAVGANCDDFNDLSYYNISSPTNRFNLLLMVDPENSIPEASEANNNYVYSEIGRGRPDLLAIIYSAPNERCNNPNQVSLSGGSSPVCLYKPTPPSLLQYQTALYANAYNYGQCPVVEPFRVMFWTRDEWCLQNPPTWGPIIRNCPWVYRGVSVPLSNLLAGSGTGVDIGTINLPLWIQYESSGTCIYRSVGLRNLSARIDTSTAYSGTPDGLVNGQYSEVSESDETNNWANGSIGLLNLSDLYSSMPYVASNDLNIKTYRYGGSSWVPGVCFSNASRGFTKAYTVNNTVQVANMQNTCPAVGNIATRLYYNCTTCSSYPPGGAGPSGCQGNISGGELLWSGTLPALYNFNLSFGLTTNKMFTGILSYPATIGLNSIVAYELCAITDVYNTTNENVEYNNHAEYFLYKAPADIEPINWGFGTRNAPGVTIAPNGTAYTCYGAGNRTDPYGNAYRYNITGQIRNNGGIGQCAFLDSFNLSIGAISSNITYKDTPYMGLGTGYANIHYAMPYYLDKFVTYWTNLSDNFVSPGQVDSKSFYWNGNISGGVSDYVRYAGSRVPLFLVVNEPSVAFSTLHYPAETNFTNNMYTAPNFAINYEAPDLLILPTEGLYFNKSRDDITHIYTLNITILNNDTSLGKCNTSLQTGAGGFNVSLYENATSVPFLISSQTINNLEAGANKTLTFTYLATAQLVMKFTVDSTGKVFERSETNNELIFNVAPTGSMAPPVEPSPAVLLKIKDESLLSSPEQGRRAEFGTGGPGPIVLGSCSLSSNPASVGPTGSMISTITINSDLDPAPSSCSLTCYPGDPASPKIVTLGAVGEIGPIIDDFTPPAKGKSAFLDYADRKASLQGIPISGSANCTYPPITNTTVYAVTAVCGSVACTSTTVTDVGNGISQPVCTGITATPANGNAPVQSTVRANYTNPPSTVDMKCDTAGPIMHIPVSGGTATITCNYSTAGDYTASSNHSSTSCGTPIHVDPPIVPSCITISANPPSGNSPLQSTIIATYTYSGSAPTVDMKCDTAGPIMRILVNSAGIASIACNYTAGNYTASSNYSTTSCSTSPITVTPAGAPYCTLTADPSSGENPFVNTLHVKYVNGINSTAKINCSNGTGSALQNVNLDVNGEGSINCFYSAPGTFTASATNPEASCAASVIVSLSAWADYKCASPYSQYITDNASYKKMPIFDDSVIKTTNLTNSTGSAAVYSQIEKTETSFSTCICCGILAGIEMFKKDPMRQGINSTRPASMVVMSDGQPKIGCASTKWANLNYTNMTGDPANDSISAACYAFQSNITVYTVGFGFDKNEELLSNISQACGGNGKYYPAVNRDDLIRQYRQIAGDILDVSYTSQSIRITGGGYTNSTLDENSHLEFTYTPYAPPLGWNDITLTLETPTFPNCKGTFSVPPSMNAYRATATSYSGSYWTKELGFNDRIVFDLNKYRGAADNYKTLGDPFNIQFEPQFAPLDNNITFVLGLSPAQFADVSACGDKNKLIYKASFPASVPFSSVLPTAEGKMVRVYYDLNADGDATDPGEGYVVLTIGQGLIGVTMDTTERSVEYLNTGIEKDNALADAMLRLLAALRFRDSDMSLNSCTPDPVAKHPPGSECNPIDIYVDPGRLASRASSIYEVPYMWGPVDMAIKVWID